MIDVSSLSVRRVKEGRYVADAYGLRHALPTTKKFSAPVLSIARGDTPESATKNLNMFLKDFGACVVNGRVEFDR